MQNFLAFHININYDWLIFNFCVWVCAMIIDLAEVKLSRHKQNTGTLMINKIMTVLGFDSQTEQPAVNDYSSRRAFPRRASDHCVGMIDGKPMPVLDWSEGGVRVFGDTRTVNVGKEIDVALKFHTNNTLIDIRHRGEIVRKSAESFAVKFFPLTSEMHKAFQYVIDNFNTEEFVASQA